MTIEMTESHLNSRIYGSLLATAVGDAMGSATEQHQIDEILTMHHGLLSRLVPPPLDTFSYRGDGISGFFTDDTSQMIALAQVLIESEGNLSEEKWVQKLLEWFHTSPYRDQMGPTTRPILEAISRGENTDSIGVVGKSTRKLTSLGVTNGAAMRVAPAGLINPGNIESAVKTAWISCQPTHDTQIAASGAGAIAAGVAMGMLPGANVDTVVQACIIGARIGEELGKQNGRCVAGPNVLRRIEIAVEEVDKANSLLDAVRRLEASVGNSVYMVESVPAAIGVFIAAGGDPTLCAVGGTNIGNDTDTIAAMACSLAGALNGSDLISDTIRQTVINANVQDFKGLTAGLSAIAWRNFISKE
jgi:ADP-ribosylglycohydrolase